MQVLIAARKPSSSSDTPLPAPNPASDRVPFDQVLRRSTVLVICLPRLPETMNLVSTPEFNVMSKYATLINIARGGIVDEAALLTALKEHRIAGYGTDVFLTEPAEGEKDSPLLSDDAKELNITVSPHLAWYAARTMRNLGQILKDTVEGWVSGKEINVIV